MKRLAIIFAILLFSSSAMALTATWTHDGLNTLGYTLWFFKTSEPNNVYNKSFPGSTVRSVSMSDDYFQPGVEYSFSVSAYNAVGESAHSAPAVKWTRAGTAYTPPTDKVPSTMYMQPSGVDTLIIQLTP